MMKKLAVGMMAVSLMTLLAAQPARSQETGGTPDHQLAEALEPVKTSLAKGLEAAQSKGKPISGKFELEDGKLQLSVYVAKGDSFSEAVVDHTTGKVAKAEAITGGEDLQAAKSQNEAMAKAKSTLAAALKKAVKANKGFTAVSIIPSLKDGHPVAEITLLGDEGKEKKSVSEKLD